MFFYVIDTIEENHSFLFIKDSVNQGIVVYRVNFNLEQKFSKLIQIKVKQETCDQFEKLLG